MRSAGRNGYNGLDRVQIKYIAIAAMLIDHIAAFFLKPENNPVLTVIYIIMRTIGRIAAPVMFFFLTEGYSHTSSKLNYGLRLLCFGIISQIPYSLARYGKVSTESLNVIITLFMSFLMLAATDRIKNQVFKGLTVFIFIMLSAFSDWGIIGTLMVWLFYTSRNDRKGQIKAYMVIVGIYLASTIAFIIQDNQLWYDGICQIGFLLVIPLLYIYNGEPGKKTLVNKWVFYLLYPLHLMIIWYVI
jgi:hypothetical protein